MATINWGILSTARIGTEKVIPAMQASEHGTVVGLASRSESRARGEADRRGIPRVYESYADLLADPDIDAVYNPLPNHLHVQWSIRALEAGKHVLCEKPIGLDAAEAETLAQAARAHPDLKAMEAFMYRFHPQWRWTKAQVDDGALGALRAVQSFFSYYNADPDNIRNVPEYGGGALMDIGCYCISLSRLLFDDEPERVSGQMEIDPRFEVDHLTSGVLAFDGGTATFTCSSQLARHQRVDVVGTEGRIEIEIPFNAPPDAPCTVHHQRGDEVETVEFDPCDQYTAQADAFARAVLNDTPVPTPLSDAVANMCVIDALRQSAEEERWVSV